MIILGKVKITEPQYKKAEITAIDSNIVYEINFAKHKAFNNDVIKYDVDADNIIEIISTEIKNKIIPGILIVNSAYKIGYKRNNIPIYLFSPLDYKYPKFYVASNVNKHKKNAEHC